MRDRRQRGKHDAGDGGRLTDLVAEVSAHGWRRGWFEYARCEVSRDHAIDDARAADWTYLVRVGPDSRVLLTGWPLLVSAMALAGRVREVWVLAGEEDATLVALWREGTETANVHVVQGNLRDGLPFREGMFDLVSIGHDAEPSDGIGMTFSELAHAAMRVLRANGTAHFVVGNWLWPARLIGGGARESGLPQRSIVGYRRVLQRVRFAGVKVFAPLPRHTRTPLCYLPLESRSAIESFMRDLFPLFAAVSPEVKRAYAVEYWLARMGVWLISAAHLGGLLKFLVPGYCILAQRVPGSAAAGDAA